MRKVHCCHPPYNEIVHINIHIIYSCIKMSTPAKTSSPTGKSALRRAPPVVGLDARDHEMETRWTTHTIDQLEALHDTTTARWNHAERLVEAVTPALMRFKEMMIACEGDICYFLHFLNHGPETRASIEYSDPRKENALTDRLVRFNENGRNLAVMFYIDHPTAQTLVIGFDGQPRPLALVPARGQPQPATLDCFVNLVTRRSSAGEKFSVAVLGGTPSGL